MRRFKEYYLEPLKFDYDDEDVFLDTNSHGINKSAINNVSMETSDKMSDLEVQGHSEKGERLSTEPERDSFAPILIRQHSWGLRRTRSSKKKKDAFRYRYCIFVIYF